MLLSETRIVLPANQVYDANLRMGRYFHVFMHETGTLPPVAPTFIISMTNNRWALIDFDVSHAHRLNTPRSRCREDQESVLHTGYKVRNDLHTCRMVARRRRVRQHCKCEAWWSPIEVWPHKSARFCGALNKGIDSAVKDFECLFNVDHGFPREFYSVTPQDGAPKEDEDLCPEPCAERRFNPQLHGGEYEISALHKLFADYYLSMYVRELAKDCPEGLDHFDPTRQKSEEQFNRCQSVYRVVRRLAMDPINIDFEPLGNTITHHRALSKLWSQAFPNASLFNITPGDTETSSKKTFLFLRIRPRESHVAVDEETLVWNMWSTVAQVGGASSFLAGVTFVVLGEILELFYYLFNCPRLRAKEAKDATNQCSLPENDVS